MATTTTIRSTRTVMATAIRTEAENFPSLKGEGRIRRSAVCARRIQGGVFLQGSDPLLSRLRGSSSPAQGGEIVVARAFFVVPSLS